MAAAPQGGEAHGVDRAEPAHVRAAAGTWGVPSFMAGKVKVAAVVRRVIFVMSFSGSASVSSSITTSQRQCGTRSVGTGVAGARGGCAPWG